MFEKKFYGIFGGGGHAPQEKLLVGQKSPKNREISSA